MTNAKRPLRKTAREKKLAKRVRELSYVCTICTGTKITGADPDLGIKRGEGGGGSSRP